MAPIIVAPSILASDFSNLKNQILQVEEGQADWLHLDIMDGHFVPNLTFGPFVVASIKKNTRLPLDVHLMIESPDRYLESFREAGADIITVHLEACPHLNRTVTRIRELGAKAGVALNPSTPTNSLTEILDEINLVLVMSVNPGYGGQHFIENSLRKISEVHEMAASRKQKIYIEVDGGIDIQSAPRVVKAGATALVAGTSIFHQKNIAEAVRQLRKSAA
jgi:ribulose-phosphate 3-epimerase